MGGDTSSEEKEEQNKKKEKEENESSKPQDESLRMLSNKYPIKENQPMILADGVYYNKKSVLGKKRQRQENSDIQNKEEGNIKLIKKEKLGNDKNNEELNEESQSEEEKKSKKKKIEENIIKNYLENKNLELKKEQSAEIEFVEHKKIEKLKIQPNSRIKYSNSSSFSFHNQFDNKKNKVDNSVNFSIHKIYDNKKEKEEKIKIAKNKSNSFAILSNHKNIKHQEKINSNIDKEIIYKDEEFSYECLNKELYVKGVQGIDHLYIDITIENNGKDWPKDNIFLRNDKEKSQIAAEEIKIISLMSGWQTKERIVFKYLNKIKPGIYYSYINLNINGKNYGKPIVIKIEILDNEEEKKLNNLINQMRKEFQLPEKDITDEELKNALMKNNFNITNAFLSIFVAD